MRALFWVYFVVFIALMIGGFILGLATDQSLAQMALRLPGATLNITGMLLYRSRRAYKQIRANWKWVAAFLASEFVLKFALAAPMLPRHFPDIWIALTSASLAVVLLVPSLWMNIQYARGGFLRRFDVMHESAKANVGVVPQDDYAIDIALAASTSPSNVQTRASRLAVNWALTVAILGAAATLVNLSLTYQNYMLARAQPRLGVFVYAVERDQEFWSAALRLPSASVAHSSNMIEVRPPLKIINLSDIDAEDVTVWLRATTKGAQLTSSSHRTETYADQEWIVTNTERLSPHSAVKLYGIVLRAPEGTKQVEMRWKVYAAQTTPAEGSVKLLF